MKLQKNMYVRTKCNDFCNEVAIRKIIEIAEEDNNGFYIDYYIIDIFGDEQDKLQIEDVEKANFNIIYVLKVGDVITTNNLCGEVTSIDGDKIYTTCYDGEYCHAEDIESVTTKEQFEQISYKLGE